MQFAVVNCSDSDPFAPVTPDDVSNAPELQDFFTEKLTMCVNAGNAHCEEIADERKKKICTDCVQLAPRDIPLFSSGETTELADSANKRCELIKDCVKPA